MGSDEISATSMFMSRCFQTVHREKSTSCDAQAQEKHLRTLAEGICLDGEAAASALTPKAIGVNAVEISGLTPWKKGR
jgi:hypothetical protein